MSEQFRPDQLPDAAALAAERNDVLGDATAERVALSAELSPEQVRTGELLAYIAEHYPECADPNSAAAACAFEETEMRSFMGDGYDITTDDPFLVEGIMQNFISESAAQGAADILIEDGELVVENAALRNDRTAEVMAAADRTGVAMPPIDPEVTPDEIVEDPEAAMVRAAAVDGAIATVRPAVLEMEETVQTNGRRLEAQRTETLALGAEADERAEELADTEALEARYSELRGSGLSQAATLQQLLSETDNPEHQDRLTEILGNISALENALPPERRALVSQMIESSNLNLGAGSQTAVFAEFLAQVDASEDLSQEEKDTLRRVLGGGERHVRDAEDMQGALRDGRGTERVPTGETELVEEPPGSGNFVEVPVYEDRVIPYTEDEPLVLSDNPRVEVFPTGEGSETYTVRALVANAEPISFTVDIPEDGAFPATLINAQVNEHIMRSILHNNGLSGTMDALFGRGDSTLGTNAGTGFDAVGQDDMAYGLNSMLFGANTLDGSRFMTEPEITSAAHDLRWLTPNGDYGVFNQVDPALSIDMMRAMFGENPQDVARNMARANQFINTGAAETPSYQALYRAMHPEDAANGYVQLREAVGAQGLALLNLGSVEA